MATELSSIQRRGQRSIAALVVGPVALAAAAYVTARAVHVPLTYDEAGSYFRYMTSAPSALFDFATANNHLLNSMLSRLSHAAFGDAALALRLPNVIAGCGFLASVAAVAMRARHTTIGAAGFMLLATNPYLMDYFALSRGYGLAIGLLTAGVCALARWYELPATSARARVALTAALALSGAAVVANFAVLSAFFSMTAVAAARLVWRGTSAEAPTGAADGGDPMWTWRQVTAWAVLTAAFSTCVFTQDRLLAPHVFVPVVVRVAGLFDEELAAISVFRRDATGRARKVPGTARGVWTLAPSNNAWEVLLVAMPAAVERNLARLDVAVGSELFQRDRSSPGPWTMDEAGSDVVLTTTPPVEWHADAAHTGLALIYAGLTVAALAAVGGTLGGLSGWLVRAGRLSREDARLLIGGVVGVASVAAAPLYLLALDGELFFGGTTSLMIDTFGSLVVGTAYGVEYHPAQVPLTLAAGAMLGAGLPGVLLVSARARRHPAFHAPAAVFAIIALVSAQTVAQHHLFGTPYLTGRTAVFLLALSLLFVMLFADALATLGRVVHVLASTALVVIGAAAVLHGASVANLSHTLDWPRDQATPQMLAVAGDSVGPERVTPGLVRIGVEWMFYPVARYYAERRPPAEARYLVTVLPEDVRAVDVLYARPDSSLRTGAVIRRFAESGAALWRVRP